MAGILRPVDVHVRVMANGEAFTIAPSLNAIALGDGPSQAVSKVHFSDESIDAFYNTTVRPAVTNALAGQSFTFVVLGAPCSGRSQTVYGDLKALKGIAQLCAEDLLAQSEVTTTIGAFFTKEKGLYPTVGDGSVALRRFPPPLGAVPMPRVKLLTNSRDAVVVSRRRDPAASYFLQFHVYRHLEQGGRCAFATLTFVDVAAFTTPVTSDLSHLKSVVQAVLAGEAADFDVCALTEVLQTSIIGATTLVPIAAVAGRPDIANNTRDVLELCGELARLRQVMALVSLIPPPWVTHVLPAVERRRVEQQEKIETAVQQAYRDYHACAVRALQRALVDGPRSAAESVLQKTASVRKYVAATIHNDVEAAAQSIAELSHDCDDMDVAVADGDSLPHEMEATRLEEECASLDATLRAKHADLEHVSSSYRLHIDHIETSSAERRREYDHFVREAQTLEGCCAEFEASIDRRVGDRRRTLDVAQWSTQCQELAKKKARLEREVGELTQRSQALCDMQRNERVRRSKQNVRSARSTDTYTPSVQM